MSRYSVAKAKAHLPKLLNQALAGETVTITRRGANIVTLAPVQAKHGKWDLAKIDARRVMPAGGPIDGAALIRQMRDESV